MRHAEVTPVPGTDTRVFVAFDELPIGALTVDDTHRTVELVVVDEDYRRRGVATALLAYARETTGYALDLDTGIRSPAGEAWAQANELRPEWRGLTRRLAAAEAEAMGAGLMSAVLWQFLRSLR